MPSSGEWHHKIFARAEAQHLIEGMSRDDLEGDEFTDRYTQAVEQLIEAKREHKEPPKASEEQAAPGEDAHQERGYEEGHQEAGGRSHAAP
jgi:DNA end-binding protein Ku